MTTEQATTISKLRGFVTVIAAVLSGALAIAASPNWGTAVLFVALITAMAVLILWVMRHITAQDFRIADCESRRGGCEKRIDDLQATLARRDVVIAVMYAQAAERSGGKRKPMVALEAIIGQEMSSAVQQAQVVLANLENEGAK